MAVAITTLSPTVGTDAVHAPPAARRLDLLGRRRAAAVRGVSGVQPARARGKPAPHLRLRRDAARQDHVLRDRRARDGPDLGLHRHPVARPRTLLRAGRLRDGHVPDALDRPRRRLPERSPRLHGVPRLEALPLVLELHRPLLVRGAAGRAGARAHRLRVRLLRVPFAHPRRLFLHHHAGADLCGDAALLPQRHGLRRQQRLHRLQAHPGLSRSPRPARG